MLYISQNIIYTYFYITLNFWLTRTSCILFNALLIKKHMHHGITNLFFLKYVTSLFQYHSFPLQSSLLYYMHIKTIYLEEVYSSLKTPHRVYETNKKIFKYL